MNFDSIYPKAVVSDKAEARIRTGHPWVFGAEVESLGPDCENGGLVHVYSRRDRWLGAAFLNLHSKIRLRLISRTPGEPPDEVFYRRLLSRAVEYRRTVMGPDFHCCRLVFGEADGLPGLTVDRFEDILVTQTLCLGIDRLKGLLFPLLTEVLAEQGVSVSAIYERNDVGLRAKEGLLPGKGYFRAPEDPDRADGHVEITENGVRYDVDYINGQKTGFFLDQKYNRAAVARLSPGKRVLDCFTHTGAFALNAAAGGAAHVCAVDVSKDALALAQANATRNGLEQGMRFLCADVFEFLAGLSGQSEQPYDFIILDPPAFTKSSSTVKSAVKGYREINRRAMGLLPSGGYLATCSCSHFMTDQLFREMLHNAASDASVRLLQVEARQQAPDHPILWNVPETDYLKFYIFQVVKR